MVRRERAVVMALVPALIFTVSCQRQVHQRTDMVVDAAEVVLIESAAGAYQVDTTGGAARVELVIVTENPTDSPVYLASCGSDIPRFVVERLAGDIWTVAIQPECPRASTPIRLGARSARSDTVTVRALLAGHDPIAGLPHFSGSSVNGTYRIVYDVYRRAWTVSDARPDTASRLPDAERRSGSFELRQ